MSSSSFWTQVRWRLGGSASIMNRISDLIQKQIDANSDAQDVTVEEILNPIVTIPSKVMMRDNLFKVALRNITSGQINYLPIDPDLDLMRLWVTNDHGGRHLVDRSFMGNTIQINGTDQSKLISANDDEGIAGSPIVNRLIEDQYIRVLDSPNVRIKEIAATAEGISVFIRLYIEYSVNESEFGKPGVLFSKLDTEQADYAYAGYLEDDGGLQFFVRVAGIEYMLSAPAASVIWTSLNLPDFESTDYHSLDYYTIATIPEIPDPTPYIDLAFIFKFSDKRMQIIKNGSTVVADSVNVTSGGTNTKYATNMKGYWPMVEGGPIGASPVNTIYDTSPNALNGLATNPLWTTADNTLQLANNNAYVSIATNTGGKLINNFTTAFTFAAWAKITTGQPATDYAGLVSNINGRSDSNKLLVKESGTSTIVLWRGHNGTSDVDSSVTLSNTGLVNDGLWHHYIVTKDSSNVKIFVDGVLKLTDSQSYSLGSGTTAMTLGWGSTNSTLYHLTGWMQDTMLWNTNLTDTEALNLYNQGRPLSYFPKWREDPPTEPPAPSPITNPFVSVYNVPLPAAAEQDSTRLHALTVTQLTERYNVNQGAQSGGVAVGEDNQYYNNNPTYDAGGSSEVLSAYNTMTTAAGQYLKLDSSQFGGERVQTGIDIIGKAVTRVIAKIADVNTNNNPATGNVVAKIVDAGGTTRDTSTTIDAATIADNQGGTSTSAWTDSTFTFNGSYVMANNDRIQFEYDQGGTGGGAETLTGYAALSQTPTGGESCNFSKFAAQRLDNSSSNLHGKVVSKVVAKLCDVNPALAQASGPVQCYIVQGNGTVMATSNTVDANTLTDNQGLGGSNWTSVTFTFSGNTYALNGTNQDYIAILFNYQGGGNQSMAVAFAGKGSNIYSNSHAVQWDNTIQQWNDIGFAADRIMDVYEGGAQTKQVGVAWRTSGGPANANQYHALWSTPTTLVQNSSNDLSMQVYVTLTGTPNHLYHPLYLTAGNPYAAIHISGPTAGLVGQRITKCTFRISRVGAPTGTLFCKIKKGSDGSTITFGLNGVAGTGLDVSTLGTTSNPSATHIFQNLDNGQITGYALQVGDRIMLELSGGSSTSGNFVQVARTHTISTLPDVQMQLSADSTTWTTPNSGTDDVIGIVAIGGHTTPIVFPYYTLGYQNQRISEKVTSITVAVGNIHNQKITQVKVWLKRVGSPTGLINAVIRDSVGTLKATLNTFDAANVADDVFTQYTFTNLSQSYTLTLNDRISLEYSGGDVNNHIQINANLLDQYPYGVLETYTGTFATQAGHDLAGVMSSGGGSTDPLARPRVGEKVATTDSAIKLKTVSRIKVRLKRTVNPPGNVLFRIRNASDTVVAELGSLSAGSIDPNTFTEYTITSNPISLYALQVGDIVSVEYNAGDEVNFVEVMTTKTTDGFDGTVKTYLVKHDDISWISNNAIDLVGQMWEGGETFTPSQEDVVLPTAVYTKDLCILAGGYPWTFIDHALSTFTHAPSQLFVNAVVPDFRFYRKVLTTTELTNIYTNKSDRATIAFGQVTKIGFFSTTET